MSLINSNIDICNLALAHLGLDSITNLEEPTTNVELICSRYYDLAKYEILRSCNFQFSIKNYLGRRSINFCWWQVIK